MQLKQICKEILQEAKKNNINDSKSFNKVKLQVLNRFQYKNVPKNATIASLASEEDRKKFKKILSMKPVRTVSGVAPIALMTDPYPCPHTIKGIGPCTYCPGGPGSPFGDVPQSYTGKEPSTRRAIRNHYDPYLGVFNRLEHYIAMGSVPEKTEVILQGGTFPFTPYIYQEYFVKYLLKAMNDFSKLFYDKDSINKDKFNKFFEMPADINNKERTKNIHKKLLFIKNLDLSNKKTLDSINYLFFNINYKKIDLINELIEQWKKFNKNNIKNLVNENYLIKLNIKKNFNKIKINESSNNKNNPNFENIKLKIKNYFNNKKNNENIDTELINQWGKINNKKTDDNNLIKINHPDLIKFNNNLSNKNENSIASSNLIAMKTAINKVKELNNPDISLQQTQKENETARIRCVGLTIETKSDYGKLIHGNQMLKLGCTRVEIGIQSIYDEVLEKTSRGNTVQDNIDSIRILKDLGFKINAHYMPGLPYTTKEMDRKGLKELFENPDYKPDMLKIYPTMVMQGTKLYDEWKSGKFKPLTTKEAAEIIAEMFSYVPEWTRVMRVQRDIPTYATQAGVDRTNLRQYVEKIMEEKNIKSKDIRAREAGINLIKNNNINIENLKIKIIEYNASKGKEFFIAAEDSKNDVLFGYCRLRFPSQFLRKEITKDSALIRELHIYSTALAIGKKSGNSFQHRGIGKKLLKKGEEIAKSNNKNKIVIISGIGVREYFRKLGYELEGPYMVKRLH